MLDSILAVVLPTERAVLLHLPGGTAQIPTRWGTESTRRRVDVSWQDGGTERIASLNWDDGFFVAGPCSFWRSRRRK